MPVALGLDGGRPPERLHQRRVARGAEADLVREDRRADDVALAVDGIDAVQDRDPEAGRRARPAGSRRPSRTSASASFGVGLPSPPLRTPAEDQRRGGPGVDGLVLDSVSWPIFSSSVIRAMRSVTRSSTGSVGSRYARRGAGRLDGEARRGGRPPRRYRRGNRSGGTTGDQQDRGRYRDPACAAVPSPLHAGTPAGVVDAP